MAVATFVIAPATFVAVATFIAAAKAEAALAEATLAPTFAAAALAAAAKAATKATLAAFTAALVAFVAALTAFVAATLAAFTAALVAATFVAAFFMTDEVAGAFFEHEARRTVGDRNRLAIAALQFVPGWARGRRSGDAFAGAHFIAPRAFGRRNRSAVTASKHIAGWAFRTVLVVAGAATTVFAIAAASQGQGAAHAEHEKSGCDQCCEALLHKRSLGSRGGPAVRLHRPQLHSIECKRVELGAPVAKHVSDVPQVIGEVFVFV